MSQATPLLSAVQQLTIPTVDIANASWWEPGSGVVIKEDLLAEDEAYIANHMMIVSGLESGKPQMENQSGAQGIFKVERMVVRGTVIVKRPGDRIKRVLLPEQAGQLMARDLAYIVKQIDTLNPPMSAEEQADFLPAASEPGVER
jgi:hypothetical protein